MRRFRPTGGPVMRMLATTLIVLALATSGCSGDDPDEPGVATTSEQSPASPSTDTEATTTEEPSEEPTEDVAEPTAATPCALLTDADVNAAYGALVGPGEPGAGSHSEQGSSYMSTTCSWEEEDSLELELGVSTAEDFGGKLACTPVSYLSDEGTAVKVPGAKSATWLASEDPNEIEARLRVCTAEVTMNLELDAASGTSVAQLRKQTVRLAAKAVAALG